MFAGTGLLVGGSGLAAGLLNGWPGTRSQPLVRDPLLPHPHGTCLRPSAATSGAGARGRRRHTLFRGPPPCWLFPSPIPMQRHCLPPPPHTWPPHSSTPSLPSPQPCTRPPWANNRPVRLYFFTRRTVRVGAYVRRLDSDLRLGARGMASFAVSGAGARLGVVRPGGSARSGGERRSGVDLPSVLFRRKDAFSRTARSRFLPPPPLFLVGRSPALLASLSLALHSCGVCVCACWFQEGVPWILSGSDSHTRTHTFSFFPISAFRPVEAIERGS